MLEQLKKDVYEANMLLKEYDLVHLTWGNVSGIDREKGLVVIKPSGVAYEDLTLEDMVVVDLNLQVVEGKYKPSSDTATHIALYQAFADIKGIAHTHSHWATVYAQAGKGIIAFGTTHADYFDGEVQITRELKRQEIDNEYEKHTGLVIAETFEEHDYRRVPAVLVNAHGPFTWGKDAKEAVEHALVLENVAALAYHTTMLMNTRPMHHMPTRLLRKHFDRKNGAAAYYGQKK
ncbi:MAG: L-ribulose-5-phosphate 4-epimerase AraD [Clostridia bacterium]